MPPSEDAQYSNPQAMGVLVKRRETFNFVESKYPGARVLSRGISEKGSSPSQMSPFGNRGGKSVKSISYVQTLRNRLKTIDALMQEIYEKGPPFPPELWMKYMKRKQAVLKTRILEIRNAAGRDNANA